jgi:hypothetical protein
MIPMGNRLGFRALDLDFKDWNIGIGKHRGDILCVFCILCRFGEDTWNSDT